jgi:hypothetical protein
LRTRLKSSEKAKAALTLRQKWHRPGDTQAPYKLGLVPGLAMAYGV